MKFVWTQTHHYLCYLSEHGVKFSLKALVFVSASSEASEGR